MNAEIRVRQIICERQGQVFEWLAKRGYNMSVFVPQYMKSDFCLLSMDARYSPYQVAMVSVIIDEIALEDYFDKIPKYENDMIFDLDMAYWIGYMYRLIQKKTNIPSDKIYEEWSLGEMCAIYAGYHTLSYDGACEWICESTGFVIEETADLSYVPSKEAIGAPQSSPYS